jgi:hypothetical protein
MSGLHIYKTTIGSQPVAAGTEETLIQIVTGTTRKVKILGWSVWCDGVTSTAVPGVVRLVRQTTAGTSSAGTNDPVDPDMPAAISTSLISFSGTMPTEGNNIERKFIHPQGGGYEKTWDITDPTAPVLDISSRVGISVNFAAAVNCLAEITWSE